MHEMIKKITVWDLPTRIFHWALVLFVAAAYLTSAGRPYGFQFLLHVISGYAVAFLLLFRLAWGFLGGEYARFAGFVTDWPGIREHALSLLRLAPKRTLGHNAIGGWMIVLMLVTLALIVITGLLTQDKTGGAGPLSGFLSPLLMRMIGETHELLGNFILYLAGFHVAGVLVESLLLRENLVRAMIDGRKHAAAAEAQDARAAPTWRAVVLVVLLAILGGYFASVTQIPSRPASGQVGKSLPKSDD